MEMEIPPKADLSKLNSILLKAKEVDKRAEALSPTKKQSGHQVSEMTERYTGGGYGDDMNYEGKEMDFSLEGYRKLKFKQAKGNAMSFSNEQISNSKLPSSIKESFIKKNIPVINNIPSRIDELVGMMGENDNQQPEQPTRKNGRMVTMSVEDLDSLIKEKITEVLLNNYNKRIIEDTVKKTHQLMLESQNKKRRV